MSTTELEKILHTLRSHPPPPTGQISTLLSSAKRLLLKLNALLPTPTTPSTHLSLARQTLETGASLTIRQQDPDGFTRYVHQLAPFYELPDSAFSPPGPGEKRKITGLYLLLLLTKGDYAGFHCVLESLEGESSSSSSLEEDRYIGYPIKLERWLMEGSYDRVWNATKSGGGGGGGGGVPSEEFAVFSEVLTNTIRSEIASCSEKAYPSLPIASAKSLLFLDSEGAVIEFAQQRGWSVHDGRVYFPDAVPTIGEGAAEVERAERDGLVASGQVIENTIGYARELETIV